MSDDCTNMCKIRGAVDVIKFASGERELMTHTASRESVATVRGTAQALLGMYDFSEMSAWVRNVAGVRTEYTMVGVLTDLIRTCDEALAKGTRKARYAEISQGLRYKMRFIDAVLDNAEGKPVLD